MPEGIVFLLKTPSWTHFIPERLFPYSGEKELLQGMVQNLTLKCIARSFDSLALVHMILQEQLMTFDSGQQNNKSCTRSYTARKVFCSDIDTWTCTVYLLPRASKTSWKLSKHRTRLDYLQRKLHSTQS